MKFRILVTNARRCVDPIETLPPNHPIYRHGLFPPNSKARPLFSPSFQFNQAYTPSCFLKNHTNRCVTQTWQNGMQTSFKSLNLPKSTPGNLQQKQFKVTIFIPLRSLFKKRSWKTPFCIQITLHIKNAELKKRSLAKFIHVKNKPSLLWFHFTITKKCWRYEAA